MRLFLIGWGDQRPELIDLVINLQNQSHQILYWTGDNLDQSIKNKFPNTIFHDFFNAYDGISPEGINVSEFDPPSSEFLKYLSTVESVVLPMMNKRFDWMSISERKHLYYNLLRYWNGVILKLKPEVIIFAGLPHAVYDFVIYELAKFLNINTIIFYQTLIKDRFLVMNDFRVGSVNFLEKIKDCKDRKYSLSDLSDDLQEIFKKQIDVATDSTPAYIKSNLDKYSSKSLWMIKFKMIVKNVKDFTIFTKTILYIIKKFQPNLKKEYIKLQSEVDFDKKFIYVPLHYQPECTTSTLGGVYEDQILMIETLATAIPKDWIIYVKEHYTQWLPRGYNFSGSRYHNYYKKISQIKNVFIVPIETNTFKLIDKTQAVATISGTPAWEALFRLKPALVFGFPWFQHGPGIFKVNDVKSCKSALIDIKNGYKFTLDSVINFLYAFDNASSRGYFSDYEKTLSKLDYESNRSNILQVLVREIDKIKHNLT